MSENNYGAIMMRGVLPASANLNNYGPVPDFIGQWSRSTNTNTTAAYGFPEDNGQGILEVFAGGRYGGLQRYTVSTSGNVYIRSLNGAWNGTDGPWSDWLPAGIQTRMSFFTGDLNTLKTPGEWSVTTPFSGGPTDVPGICEVIPRLNGTGLLQRYTAIATGAASINRTWQRTLSGTTWSGWEPVGIKPLNDLGIGLTNLTALTALDWQQFDFTTGATYLISSSVWSNAPTGVTYDASTQVFIRVDGITSSGTVIELTLIPNTSGNSNFRCYKVRIGSAKGSRVFSVRQLFSSADKILAALAGLTPTVNQLPYFSGADTAALTALTALARTLLGNASAADMQSTLGLGNAATRTVGAGGVNNLPDMSFFQASIAPNGWFKYPCIDQYNNPKTLIIQFATIQTNGGTDKGYPLPFVFPNVGLFATGNRATSGYNAAMNVRIANASTVSIQNWGDAGALEDCCVIAVGW